MSDKKPKLHYVGGFWNGSGKNLVLCQCFTSEKPTKSDQKEWERGVKEQWPEADMIPPAGETK